MEDFPKLEEKEIKNTDQQNDSSPSSHIEVIGLQKQVSGIIVSALLSAAAAVGTYLIAGALIASSGFASFKSSADLYSLAIGIYFTFVAGALFVIIFFGYQLQKRAYVKLSTGISTSLFSLAIASFIWSDAIVIESDSNPEEVYTRFWIVLLLSFLSLLLSAFTSIKIQELVFREHKYGSILFAVVGLITFYVSIWVI